MDAKKMIDALRVCADDDIICPACERYGKECDGTSDGPAGLMLKAAELLESQRKRIERLANIINTHYDHTCGKCDYTRDTDMRCMCDKSQWAGCTVRADNYCGHFEPRNEPLTLEELRQTHAPVWCLCELFDGGNGFWCLCINGKIIAPSGNSFDVEEIPNWVFLRRKPKEDT